MPHIDLALDTLPEDQPIRVEGGEYGVVVVRTGADVVAYEDKCPHAQWRLSAGEVINGRLECPGHGWEFQLATGRCVTVPTYCLRAVRVEASGAGTVRVIWDDRSAPVAANNDSSGV